MIKDAEAVCSDKSYFSEVARLVGQKVAVLCARYHYRGILSNVFADGLMLTDATVVEQSGSASQERPTSEDPINGTVWISKDAVEIVHQCRWVSSPLPNEDDYEKQSNR